jgi:hypothetical protein
MESKLKEWEHSSTATNIITIFEKTNYFTKFVLWKM